MTTHTHTPAKPAPNFRSLSPSNAESAHSELKAGVGFASSKQLETWGFKEQTAAWVLDCYRQAETQAGVNDSDREPGSAIANKNSLLLLAIRCRQPKDFILAPKSALRKTVESNAPACARRPKPDARDEPVTNPTQDAGLHLRDGEVAEHRIGQVVKSKTRQTEAVERLLVPTASGKEFEVHAGVSPANPRRILPCFTSSWSNLALRALKICCRLKEVPPLSGEETPGR